MINIPIYVILPTCTDLNRGDQALVWETKRHAEKAGFVGDYYMFCENSDEAKQSKAEGIFSFSPILKHPGRKTKKNNIKYDISLMIQWGFVALIDLFRSLFILLMCNTPLVNLFLSSSDKYSFEILRNSSACFVKGGGFIHSYGGITDLYTIYFQLFHIALVQRMSKNVYVMPNSFGPFKAIGTKHLVKKILNKCKLIAVRESISFQMLSDIGVKSIQCPDLAFGLQRNDKEIPNEILVLKNEFYDRKLVAITVRPYRFPESIEPEKKYIQFKESFVRFAKWLYSDGFMPIFIDHTLSSNNHEKDILAIQEISMHLNKDEYRIISNPEFTCRDLKSIYSQCDYIVGTRFHSVIFSISEEVPAVAITYGGNKGQGIMKDMELKNYAISITDITFDILAENFKKLCDDQDIVCEKIKQYKKYVKHTFDKMILLMK